MNQFLENAAENRRRLDSCKTPHEFELTLETASHVFGQRYRCKLCQGEISAPCYYWYQVGLLHGAKAAEAIVVKHVVRSLTPEEAERAAKDPNWTPPYDRSKDETFTGVIAIVGSTRGGK